MLCKKCESLDITRLARPPEFVSEHRGVISTHLFLKHPKSTEELETTAAAQHCHLCYLIATVIQRADEEEDEWDCIEEDGSDDGDSDGEVLEKLRSRCRDHFIWEDNDGGEVEEEGDLGECGVLLEFIFGRALRDVPQSRTIDIIVRWGRDERRESGHLLLVSHLPKYLDDLAICRNVFEENSTSSSYAFKLARYWYDNCRINHRVCHESRVMRGSGLPTRVLDICPTDQSIECYLYISVGEDVPYACLSHCWGTEKVIKTEKSSIEARRKGINLGDMPQTFLDAVVITRNLGIRYLWIDSLCIVQDDVVDWDIQSANMDQIYMNASITIAAVDADADTRGCFRSSPGAQSGLCRTPMFDGLLSRMLGETSHTFIQQKLLHVGGPEWSIRGNDRQKIGRLSPIFYGQLVPSKWAPLHTRAWTLQENVLSVAMLSYEQTEIRWSCATTLACECIPEGFNTNEEAERSNQSLSQSLITKPPKQDVKSTWHVYYMWYRLLEIYTGRALTYDKDRLPALAGLAKEMSRVVRSDYLAGLWRNNLRVDLAWYRHAGSKVWFGGRNMSSHNRIPSWSWASVTGAVQFRIQPEERQRPIVQLEAEIISCDVEYNENNEFGSVKAGKLVLRGRLKHARVLEATRRMIRNSPLFEGRLSVFDPNTLQEFGGFEPDDRSWIADEVWCMPILASDSGYDKLSCLALTPSGVRDGVQEYQRVGMIGMCYEREGLLVDMQAISASTWFANQPSTTVVIT